MASRILNFTEALPMIIRVARGLGAACLLALGGTRLHAQTPAVLALPDGRVVEVLGLRRWTLQMLQDSLARYAPGDSLQSHSCAATLRYRLGFADAAASTFVLDPARPPRVVVSLREPQDSARVRYRVLPMDTTPGRREWRVVTEVMRTRPGVFWPAAQAHAAGEAVLAQRLPTATDSAAGAAVLAFLRARTTERDRRAAHEALRRSPNVFDRGAAALILGNFPARDDTWHALLEASREADGPAKAVAATVLERLGNRAARRVDWTPVTFGIHAMLDGTSLFQVPTLVRVLARTGVGPAQAPGFLRGGGEMLLAYLGSGTSMLSEPAHQLLVQLRGADLGPAPGPWRAWIARL